MDIPNSEGGVSQACILSLVGSEIFDGREHPQL